MTDENKEDEEVMESDYDTDLDDDCPSWLKDITKNSFNASYEFIKSYQLWVTRTKKELFGPKLKYWILIVGSPSCIMCFRIIST